MTEDKMTGIKNGLVPPTWLPTSKAFDSDDGYDYAGYNSFNKTEYTWLDGIAIAQKLERMDAAGKGDALANDYNNLQNDITKTKDLLAAADVQVKVGDDSKDILTALRYIYKGVLRIWRGGWLLLRVKLMVCAVLFLNIGALARVEELELRKMRYWYCFGLLFCEVEIQI